LHQERDSGAIGTGRASSGTESDRLPVGAQRQQPAPASRGSRRPPRLRRRAGFTLGTRRREPAPGDLIQGSDGPFTGFFGRVRKVDTERRAVLVLVRSFGRVTPVELDFNQVGRLDVLWQASADE